MRIQVTKEFTFDSAHHLTKYYGKCERVHGHTYRLKVTVSGEVQSNGMAVDFVILKRIIKKHILNKLDHHNLNDYFENPTAEVVAQWIWNELENIEDLLKEEIQDPNLDEEIKKYLQEPDSELLKANHENKIQLEKIQLWETPTSSVTIKR